MGCPTASFWGFPIKEKRLKSMNTLNFLEQGSVGAFQAQRKGISGRKGDALKSVVKQQGIRRKVNTTWDAPLDPTKLLKKIRLNFSIPIAKSKAMKITYFFLHPFVYPMFDLRFKHFDG